MIFEGSDRQQHPFVPETRELVADHFGGPFRYERLYDGAYFQERRPSRFRHPVDVLIHTLGWPSELFLRSHHDHPTMPT